ncbi:MAG: hypothetical protein V3T53_09895 [Phycisphaerales bacterium]
MEKHVSNVGVLFVFFGGQGVFVSAIVLLMISTGASLSGDEAVAATMNRIGLVTVVPFLIIESLKIVAGIALLQQRPGARIPVLILSFLSLLAIPIGTAYGFYAIWVLMKDDTVRLLAKAADAK